MNDRTRHGTGAAAQLVRVLRWQERTEWQVWLVAGGIGLVCGAIYVAVTSHYQGWAVAVIEGLIFGGVVGIAGGLTRRHRLRTHQPAQGGSSPGPTRVGDPRS